MSWVFLKLSQKKNLEYFFWIINFIKRYRRRCSHSLAWVSIGIYRLNWMVKNGSHNTRVKVVSTFIRTPLSFQQGIYYPLEMDIRTRSQPLRLTFNIFIMLSLSSTCSEFFHFVFHPQLLLVELSIIARMHALQRLRVSHLFAKGT